MSPAEQLAEAFLDRAKSLHAETEPIRVLKERAYAIGGANVLIRAASESANHRYFFGLNYIHAEEMANLDNAFFAFVCGSAEQVVILPASELINHLPLISHDRNGEYKINIDRELNLVLTGRGNRLACGQYINAWDQLLKPSIAAEHSASAEESVHSVVQGRLLEIGRIRGFDTFCPDKKRKFNGKPLEKIATLEACPQLQYSEYDLLRKIDVLWFRERGTNYIPECAFEVELSTGTWSGVGRLAQLIDYSNTRLYIISNEPRKFERAMTSYPEYKTRYKHLPTEVVGDLYSAEINLREVRDQVGL